MKILQSQQRRQSSKCYTAWTMNSLLGGALSSNSLASVCRKSFPLIASEAFISSTFDSFIPPALVIKARKERIEEDNFGWGLIVGVDPAGMGPDRTSIAWRRGRRILKVEFSQRPRHNGGRGLGGLDHSKGRAGSGQHRCRRPRRRRLRPTAGARRKPQRCQRRQF